MRNPSANDLRRSLLIRNFIHITLLKKIYWFLFIYDLNDRSAIAPIAGDNSIKKKLMRDVSYLVLFSYILLIFNSAVPIFSDIVAHTFWEKQHLLTVHKENGKYHVHFQVLNMEKQAAKDKSSGSSKSNSDDQTHIVPFSAHAFMSRHFTIQSYCVYQYNYSFTFQPTLYQPPRA